MADATATHRRKITGMAATPGRKTAQALQVETGATTGGHPGPKLRPEALTQRLQTDASHGGLGSLLEVTLYNTQKRGPGDLMVVSLYRQDAQVLLSTAWR